MSSLPPKNPPPTQTSFLARLGWALALVLWVVAGFVLADLVTASGDESEAAAASYDKPPNVGLGAPRAFVFLVDSLRDRTATDPAVMPYLAAMPGLRATVLSSRDAITVSAIRAMFTGREQFTIFGFVKNFTHGREQLESLFSQWRGAGVSVSVYSDGSFSQFGEDIPDPQDYPHLPDDERDYQDEIMRRALEDFLSGRHQVVVAHLTYSDHAAHEHGVGAPQYIDAFGRVDALVREFDRAIPPDVTFVVTGDHGHTDDGRHALGLDIPTYVVYRGPRFAQTQLSEVLSIRAHRCLLSWATGQAPVAGCESSELLGALKGDASFVAQARTRLSGARAAQRSAWGAVWGALGVCGLIALWGVLFGSVWGFWGGRRVWATLGGGLGWMLLGAAWEWAVPIATLWAGVGVWGLLKKNPVPPKASLWVSGAGLLLWAWGHGLALGRAWVHEPSAAWMMRLWFVWMVGVGVWAARKGRIPWWVLGGPLLLFYPTVYGYGALSGLANVGLAWALAVGLNAKSQSQRREVALLLGCGVALCWQPFGLSEGFNFIFYYWYPWVESLAPSGWYAWAAVGLMGRALLLVDFGAPRWVQALSVLAAVGLGAVSWRDAPGLSLGLIGVLGLGAWALRRRGVLLSLGRLLARGVLLVAFYHFVRVPEHMYRQGELMLAGVLLGAYFVKRALPPEADTEKHKIFLHCMAVGFAGWMSFSWTFQSLEWLQSYDWFEAFFVESNVVLFVPIIVLKYGLPIVLMRRRLHAVLGPVNHQKLWTVVMVKAGALLLVTLGIAAHLPNTGVYLESIQETTIFVILCLGLV